MSYAWDDIISTHWNNITLHAHSQSLTTIRFRHVSQKFKMCFQKLKTVISCQELYPCLTRKPPYIWLPLPFLIIHLAKSDHSAICKSSNSNLIPKIYKNQITHTNVMEPSSLPIKITVQSFIRNRARLLARMLPNVLKLHQFNLLIFPGCLPCFLILEESEWVRESFLACRLLGGEIIEIIS